MLIEIVRLFIPKSVAPSKGKVHPDDTMSINNSPEAYCNGGVYYDLAKRGRDVTFFLYIRFKLRHVAQHVNYSSSSESGGTPKQLEPNVFWKPLVQLTHAVLVGLT